MQLRIENFAGEMPIRANTLLPDNFASYSKNGWYYNGHVRGWRYPLSVYTCVEADTVKTFRIPTADTAIGGFDDSIWMEFDDESIDVVRAPMINDSFSRFYWAGPSISPLYNTQARIAAGNTGADAPFFLGIPTPVSTPTITIGGTSTTNLITRSYVYTFVSAYGEEGPPSPPVVLTDSANNTWTLNWTAPTSLVTTGRNLTHINIYRTIANGQGQADFYFVEQVTIATTTYADSALDTEISGNNALQSMLWTPPPLLQGMVSMPNGIIAGWANERDIWFCEPYRPHAWPSSYTVSVANDIVGMSVIGMSLVVATEGNPYIVTGIHPSVMSISQLGSREPCLSRHSIAASPDGVYYASPNGLMLINPSSASIVTGSLFSRQDWAALRPDLFRGVCLGRAYIGYTKSGSLVGGEIYDGLPSSTTPSIDGLGSGTPVYDGLHFQWVASTNQGDNGFIIDPSNENTLFTRIAFPGVIQGAYQDKFNGQVCLIATASTKADGTTVAGPVVYEFDPQSTTARLPYIWRSKKFQAPFKQSFIACKVFFDVMDEAATIVLGDRNTSQTQTFNKANQYLLLRVYADERLALVREIQKSGELIQLPSGFRADLWQFELNGQVAVKNIQIATSVKELQGV